MTGRQQKLAARSKGGGFQARRKAKGIFLLHM